ncbi:hypothetical protein ABW21_db0208220 [Orbilia brochopaga]|nr:hypothetical protein ABW21_db0208220 [Drechslerella brochopaga]
MTRSSPTPEPDIVEIQIQSQKPRRKRLTRTKPTTRTSTESQPQLDESFIGASLTPVSSLDPETEQVNGPLVPSNDAQTSYHEHQSTLEQNSPVKDPIGTGHQLSNTHGGDDPVLSPPVTSPQVLDEKSQDVSNDRTPGAADEESHEATYTSLTPSTRVNITTIASFSPSKDKDMKRKSDAIAEHREENARSGKKRKTIPKAVLTPKGIVAVVPDETGDILQKNTPRQVLHTLNPKTPKDSAGYELQKCQYTPSRVPSQPVENALLCTNPGLENRSPGLGLQTDLASAMETEPGDVLQEDLEEEDTIPDVILEDPGTLTRKSLVKEADAIDTALSSDEPYETGRQPLPRGGSSDLQRQVSDGLSPPNSPADTASQDSIPNTQFSAAASQMTLATSFQGSNKGVSFVTTAEEQHPGEREASLTVETRARSPSVSPKPKVNRTPLTVVSKAHNGGLALMTPRNRTDAVAFAPVRSLKPWRSEDIEGYIDGLKENIDLEVEGRMLPASERNMTIGEWITEVARKAEKRLIDKGELLVGFFEAEAEHAVAAIEAIEAE